MKFLSASASIVSLEAGLFVLTYFISTILGPDLEASISGTGWR